jgi:uncharacterized membrane protein
MSILNTILNNFIDVSILLFEFVGAIIIILSGIKGVLGYIKKDPLIRLNLAKGLALGLEFKLGSEILRTVVVREFSEMLVVGGIIALRAALTFLIHWEIRTEESHPEKQ